MGENRLFEPLTIRNTTVQNRVCIPPMITYGSGDNAGPQRIGHYRRIAAGGAGLIIVEATCVTDKGQLGPNQMGIWSDSHVKDLRELASAIHSQGTAAVIQLHHAGVVGWQEHLCPSAYRLNGDVTGKKMTETEIEAIKLAFIEGGRRAYEAGFDGVELHGCHSYLISQFLNRRVNRRGDVYGQQPTKLPIDILRGIRAATGSSFIVGIRLGAFEPTLEDGLYNATQLDKAGFDFLDISYGFSQEQSPCAPKGFPYPDVIYAAGEIKKTCAAPVFAVNQIRTPEQARHILALTGVDMIDIGRATLTDYNWVNKAKRGESPVPCLGCKKCLWYPDGTSCPGRRQSSPSWA